jgi:hypothetical protein
VAATVIIGLVAAYSMSTTSAILWSADRQRRNTEAMALARLKLSEIELLSDSALLALMSAPGSGVFAPPYMDYEWRTRAARVAGEFALIAITVEVEWPSGRRQLETRLFRP